MSVSSQGAAVHSRAIAAMLYLRASRFLDGRAITGAGLKQSYVGLHAALKFNEDLDIARRDLSLVCVHSGRYDEALRHADRRIGQGERDHDVVMRASGLTQRGEALEAMGRHGVAAEAFRSAMALLDPDDPRQFPTYWAALSDKGAALVRAGQFAEAYQAQHEAYSRAAASARQGTAALAAAQLALISVYLAQPERALEWTRDAKEHLRQETSAGPDVVAEVQVNRSLALSAVGKYDEAANGLSAAQPLVAGSPLVVRQLRLTSAQVAEEAGRYDEAAGLLSGLLADRQLDPGTRAMVLNSRAVIRMRQGESRRAISDLRDSLALRRQIGDPRGIATTLSNLVRADLEVGDITEAARYVDESERLWRALADDAPDEPGRAGLAELIRPVVSQARQELCLSTGDITGAMVAAERGRQGPLAGMLANAHPGTAVPAEPPGVDRIRALSERLNATLILYSAQLRPDSPQPRLSWASQLRAINQWAITPSGQVSHAVVPAAGLVALHEAVLRAEREQQMASTMAEEIWTELSQLVLHPVADALPATSDGRVIVLPAPFMWPFPFAALPLPDGEPLLARCPVSYAPSLHALEYLAAACQAGRWYPRSALVVGAPDDAQALEADGSYRNAVPLPAARDAAERVAGMYGQVPLTGPDCTVQKALSGMPGKDLIHIESHADVDSSPRFDRPPGTIMLAPSGTDHGQLTSDLIENMHLDARLVVLAACSTGLGMPASEGVRGLVRAFFCAGACGVIASLWPVVDMPAAMTMTWFHRELSQTGDPAGALRTAALMARNRWKDPMVWAAFTLYGL
jgi:CHAT domain-containing protein/tetratricopeptide (TPR) repeat protein